MKSDSRWAGIHAILPTPFTSEMDVDLEGYRTVVRRAIEGGSHVIVALGTQGEFYALSVDERKSLIEATVEAARSERPVIVGVSDASTLAAVELARHAASVGADALMLTPPYFVQTTEQTAAAHVIAAARETDLPVFLYNAPDRAGFNWTPQAMVDLAEREERIVGIKQATPNVHELAETVALLGNRLAVIGGSEGMILQTLAVGMEGCTSTTATFWAEPFLRIYDSMRDGRLAEAQALFMQLAPLRRWFSRVGHAAAVKIAMDAMGLPAGPMRPPLSLPDAKSRAAVLEAFESCGLRIPEAATSAQG